MQHDPADGAGLDLVEDPLLVARAQDGDTVAFGVLLRRHERTLRRYVDRLLRNSADTEDVLQETALSAWRALDGLEDPAKVRAWLIRIATREAFRAIAARPDSRQLDEDALVQPGPDAAVERLDLQQALQAALDALPQQQAQCWILREIAGYSYGDIAQELCIPESTVRGSLAQARKTILTRLGGFR